MPGCLLLGRAVIAEGAVLCARDGEDAEHPGANQGGDARQSHGGKDLPNQFLQRSHWERSCDSSGVHGRCLPQLVPGGGQSHSYRNWLHRIGLRLKPGQLSFTPD
uniref:Secreted protein n=1 Tax=Ixodes ricinus TaxID=34613 RepID=A0A6B0UHH4_IXORI